MQEGDLKQWSVTVITSNDFSFVLQSLNLKQILNANCKPGCRFCSNECLHILTSGPGCQCPPKLCTPQSQGFSQKQAIYSSNTVTDLTVVCTKMFQAKKFNTQHTYSQHPRTELGTGAVRA